jgi:hypothetical protein
MGWRAPRPSNLVGRPVPNADSCRRCRYAITADQYSYTHTFFSGLRGSLLLLKPSLIQPCPHGCSRMPRQVHGTRARKERPQCLETCAASFHG